MSRYIEYEPIMAKLEKEVKLADDWKTAHEIANVVKYAQSIDIVRCGECENYDEEFHNCVIRDCYGWDYKPNDFCSYGEPKEKEAE